MGHEGPERRTSVTLSEEDMDRFIDRALDRASNRFLVQVGKSVLSKLAWMVGAVIVGLYFLGKNKSWW